MKKRIKMKNSIILTNIRKIALRHLIIPIITIAVTSSIICFLPFRDVFSPVIAHSSQEAIESIESGKKYIKVTVPKLIYSGYKYMKNNKVYGLYYYDLADNNTCLFYLLDPSRSEKHTLTNVTLTVRADNGGGIFGNMLDMFAAKIGWTSEGVKSITKSYILNENEYNYALFLFIFIALSIVWIYCLVFILYNLLLAMFPFMDPDILLAMYHLRKKNVFKTVSFIDKELAESKISHGGMYITDHFFINIGKSEFSVVLLNQIVFAYDHSTLHSLFGIHLNVTYTLHLKCYHMRRSHCPQKTVDDINAILDYFKENEPDILIGHTAENKLLAKEIIKNETIDS